MGTFARMKKYAETNFNVVHHTTLNPEGPGVVRIHLIPPKSIQGEIGSSVAIINGQDVIPVNSSWSILLSELIEQINVYSGKPVTDEDVKNIIKATCTNVKKVFRFVSRRRLRKELEFAYQTQGYETNYDIEVWNINEWYLTKY